MSSPLNERPMPGRAVYVPGTRDSFVYILARALVNWMRAVALDALIVGVLWWVGLSVLHVPWAPMWAVLGALFQFVPVVGGMLAVAGPAIAVVLGHPGDKLLHLSMVLGLYAAIVLLDGLVIGPYVLHRITLVPWWAALAGPVVLGLLIPPWGVLIAPPLLAVVFGWIGTGDSPRV